VPTTSSRSPTNKMALLTFILPGISFSTSKAMPSYQPGSSVLTSRPSNNVYPSAPVDNVPATFLSAEPFTRPPELVAIRIGPPHLCRMKCENGKLKRGGVSWNSKPSGMGSRGPPAAGRQRQNPHPLQAAQRDAAPARSKAGPRQVNYRMSCPSGFIADAG
jgi:hypothetical protein